MSGKLTNMHNFSTLTGATGQLLNQTLFNFPTFLTLDGREDTRTFPLKKKQHL